MAEVHNHLGDDDATAAGFSRYQFSGKPGDQFENTPPIGEKRVMTVTVEVTGHEEKATANEGIQRIVKLKVVEAEVGKLAKKAPEDPTLFGDPDEDAGPREEFGDYRPEDPDGDWVPPVDQIGKRGEGRAPDAVRDMFSDASD